MWLDLFKNSFQLALWACLHKITIWCTLRPSSPTNSNGNICLWKASSAVSSHTNLLLRIRHLRHGFMRIFTDTRSSDFLEYDNDKFFLISLEQFGILFLEQRINSFYWRLLVYVKRRPPSKFIKEWIYLFTNCSIAQIPGAQPTLLINNEY